MKLEETGRNWEKFASVDPLWAILTDPSAQGNRWNEDQFFATGKEDVSKVLGILDSQQIKLKKGKVLDFGCGVGRLTQALGDSFEEVIGVDIAPTMIQLAKRYNKRKNVSYICNLSEDLSLFRDGDFDFIYSMITLQHMAPRYARKYIAEFLRILKPDGICLFQMPSHFANTRWSVFLIVARWIRYRLPRSFKSILNIFLFKRSHSVDATMEMHCIPIDEVVLFVSSKGGRVYKVFEDGSAGDSLKSFMYLVCHDRQS